jgi:putative ABC transport system permease protein
MACPAIFLMTDMISPRYTLWSAYQALRANMVRSSLTVLGIVIGITAIMLIVALGEGAQRIILSQVEGMGADTIVLRPGMNPKGPSEFAQTLFSDAIKDREIDALRRRENVPELVDLSPIVFVAESVSYEGEVARPTIYGWSAEFMMNFLRGKLLAGEIFSEMDIKQEASVAIIGTKLAEDLFGFEDPIGKTVRIKGHNFRVIGIFDPKSSSPLFDVKNVMLVPYTTARTYISGKDYYQEVMIKVTSPKAVDRSVEDIRTTLRELHNITDPDKEDFYIETQQGTIERISTIFSALTAFLAAVVAISLVVGGIGVMNVMLVSVTERTREIGLRKALGARSRDILAQFLSEATMLTIFGGIIGVTLGSLLGYLAAKILSQTLAVDWTFAFPLQATTIGIGVSAAVGLLFGGYPAWKASKKSPIEALRYE